MASVIFNKPNAWDYYVKLDLELNNNNNSLIFYSAFQWPKDAHIKHEEGDDNQGEQAEYSTTENRSKVECDSR